MDDKTIIDMYFSRDDKAIEATNKKYGSSCRRVAENILNDKRDSEECVNDTWLAAWKAMPPKYPEFLGAFLAKITRNLSLSRLRMKAAEKRKGNEATVCIDELSECIPDKSKGKIVEELELRDVLERFLDGLSKDQRRIFLRRYWYVCTIKQIAAEHSISEGAVKMSLSRTRSKLKKFLEEEGIEI